MANDVADLDVETAPQKPRQPNSGGALSGVVHHPRVRHADVLHADCAVVEAHGVPAHHAEWNKLEDPPVGIHDEVGAEAWKFVQFDIWRVGAELVEHRRRRCGLRPMLNQDPWMQHVGPSSIVALGIRGHFTLALVPVGNPPVVDGRTWGPSQVGLSLCHAT